MLVRVYHAILSVVSWVVPQVVCPGGIVGAAVAEVDLVLLQSQTVHILHTGPVVAICLYLSTALRAFDQVLLDHVYMAA